MNDKSAPTRTANHPDPTTPPAEPIHPVSSLRPVEELQALCDAATPVRLVRQEHDYGCGLASLAMICDRTYDGVKDWLLASWPGGQADGGKPPEQWLEKRGIYDPIVDWYLSHHGYVWQKVYAGWAKDNPSYPWPPAPFAPVHLAMVRQPSGNSHYVVMRADGVVLDPMSDDPRTLADWPSVDNVRGVWHLPALLARLRAAEETLAAVGALANEWRAYQPAGSYAEANSYADAVELCGDALVDMLADAALPAVEQGSHCCPPCAVHTPGDDGLTLAALSDWIDIAPANASRDPEAATWGRLAKVSEEIGEAREAWFDCLDVANGRLIAAFIGATGQNPRKGVTHDRADVLKELLDVALTALCAVEHMTGNTGRSMGELSEHIHRVAVRANIPAAALAEGV